MKTFIIHLSKIETSLSSANKVKEQLASVGMRSELFEGTYGCDAIKIFANEGREVHPISFKGLPIDDIYVSNVSKPGSMGCFLSHYRLWEKCIELNETIGVFEDDVEIHRALIPVAFDDILILSLGVGKSYRYLHHLLEPTGEPAAIKYNHLSMPGASGYLISPTGAKKLLDTYTSTFSPADNAINSWVVDLKIHNYLVGRANVDKLSLTDSSDFWKSWNTSTI